MAEHGAADGRHIGILGGGALGLAAGLRLAHAGNRVTLIEREPHLGGLAAGFQVGPSALEKFYHHIFGTDRDIIRMIGEVGLGERLVWKQPNTSTLANGRIVKMSSIPSLLTLPLLPPIARFRFLIGMAVLKVIPNERPFGNATASTWMRGLMGKTAYRAIWEPVLHGKFGERADEIAMSWLWSRVHERTLRLGYVRGGFQQFYDRLGERIQSAGGTILLGTAANSLEVDDGGIRVRTSDSGDLRFDQVLSTLPTRLFAQVARGLPADYLGRHPGPDHYGAHVLILALDRPLTQDVYWLNVNDRDLPFLALVEHTHFMPPEDYGGRHLVYLGNYLPMDHPLFQQSEQAVRAQYLQALKRIRPDFRDEWVTESWMFRAPYAQPIMVPGYTKLLPPHRTPLRGVYLANMAHVYPQDRGQNYSLRLGERMARLMQADAEGQSPA